MHTHPHPYKVPYVSIPSLDAEDAKVGVCERRVGLEEEAYVSIRQHTSAYVSIPSLDAEDAKVGVCERRVGLEEEKHS
jgi:hypothetical protein